MKFIPAIVAFLVSAAAHAQAVEPVKSLAAREKQPLLDTLKALVSIESGSRDREGLDRIAALVAGRLQALGGRVEQIEPGPDVYKMHDTPEKIGKMVRATFAGTGQRKMNWTMAQAGVIRNMIPPAASAAADVRVLRVADYDGVEQAVREKIKNKLLPESVVEMNFERRRPPLEATSASRALSKYAQGIYRELGLNLNVGERAEGGGTDAAFASLKAKGAVIERFGLRGFGAHSADAEYVVIQSIEPRLYLAVRMIMDFALEKGPR